MSYNTFLGPFLVNFPLEIRLVSLSFPKKGHTPFKKSQFHCTFQCRTLKRHGLPPRHSTSDAAHLGLDGLFHQVVPPVRSAKQNNQTVKSLFSKLEIMLILNDS